MLRRRLLATLLLAGVPLAATAQSATCGGSGGDENSSWSVSLYDDGSGYASGREKNVFPYNASPAGPPVDVSYLLRGSVSSPEVSIEVLLSTKGGPSLAEPATLQSLSFKMGGEVIWSPSLYGAEAATVYPIDSSGAAPTPGARQIANALVTGQPVTVVLTLSSGRALEAPLSFTRIAGHMATATRTLAAERNRMAAGQCAGSPSIGCFLTTAAVQTVGLDDDCWELRTLRRFRDQVLMHSERGRELVEDYYRRAPAIVAAISARPDANRQWLRTWAFGVVPSAIAAQLGLKQTALGLYARMTNRLSGLVAE